MVIAPPLEPSDRLAGPRMRPASRDFDGSLSRDEARDRMAAGDFTLPPARESFCGSRPRFVLPGSFARGIPYAPHRIEREALGLGPVPAAPHRRQDCAIEQAKRDFDA